MASGQPWFQDSTVALSSQQPFQERPIRRRPEDSGPQRGAEVNSRALGAHGGLVRAELAPSLLVTAVLTCPHHICVIDQAPGPQWPHDLKCHL